MCALQAAPTYFRWQLPADGDGPVVVFEPSEGLLPGGDSIDITISVQPAVSGGFHVTRHCSVQHGNTLTLPVRAPHNMDYSPTRWP